MKRNLIKAVCLSAAVCTVAALAQVAFGASSNSTVAYVYVSGQTAKNSGKYHVMAFAVNSKGELTTVPGSPFAADVSNMAVNGKYLFGSDMSSNDNDIDTWMIHSNGSLTFTNTTSVREKNGNCDTPGAIFLDHTGHSLYNNDYNCENATYQAFAVENGGTLKFLDYANAGSPSYEGVLSFIGNNEYAYGASCYHFTPDIYGVKRSSSGALSMLKFNPPFPPAKSGSWCPAMAASDTTNHLAVPMVPSNDGGQTVPYQLATYTVSSTGALSTSSTAANMPKVAVGTVLDIDMAPGGKLLAVAGTSGLQIFHFNGAAPMTAYTGLLTKDQVNEVFWDNDNHLFAVSQPSGKLFVFTVTPSGYSQAAGSPHTIANPLDLIVQPLP